MSLPEEEAPGAQLFQLPRRIQTSAMLSILQQMLIDNSQQVSPSGPFQGYRFHRPLRGLFSAVSTSNFVKGRLLLQYFSSSTRLSLLVHHSRCLRIVRTFAPFLQYSAQSRLISREKADLQNSLNVAQIFQSFSK